MGTVKTLVALSGGVDSSTAAYLLKEEGSAPAAVFMRHPYQPVLDRDETERFWSEAPGAKDIPLCAAGDGSEPRTVFWTPDRFPMPRDAADALRVARSLDIPFFIYDAEPVFQRVVGHWTGEYLAGRTPNPCVLCNRILKFGALIDLARRRGFSSFATGHYIRRTVCAAWRLSGVGRLPDWLAGEPDDAPVLLRGNSEKDQSYVLCGVSRERLAMVNFPLAGLTKPQVRQIAADARIPVAQKRESQDLCFVPAGEAPFDFLRRTAGPTDTAGNFVSRDGTVLGAHRGYEKYTVGQRKGLGIGFGERTFVQAIVPLRKEVVLGTRDDLARSVIRAADANWIAPVPIGVPFRVQVKIRYRSAAAEATVSAGADGTVTARLDEPRFGVAPGQSLVCYWKDRLIGGGIIAENRE